MKSKVGVHIGQTSVEVAEVGGKTQIKYRGSAPFVKDSPSDVVASAIKKALEEARIKTNNVVTALPSSDVIVRYIEMPHIPKKNLDAAVRYEARKFVPFKPEEMVFDFQVFGDDKKTGSGIRALLAAAKNDNLSRHLEILKEAGLKAEKVDVVLSSLMRVLWSSKQVTDKDTVGIVYIDAQSADISIVHNGIPYLSRDVMLSDTEGLIKEIVLSLEYHRKQYRTDEVSKILLCGVGGMQDIAKAIGEELGLSCDVVESADTACAYGLALKDIYRCPVEIDFLRHTKEEKTARLKIKALQGLPAFKWVFLEAGVAIALLFGFYSNLKKGIIEADKQVKAAEANKPAILPSLESFTAEQLEQILSKEKERIKDLKARLDEAVPVIPKFAVIDELLPDTMWLEEFSWQEEWQKNEGRYRREMTLSGFLFSEGAVTAKEEIDRFADILKRNNMFFAGFENALPAPTANYTRIKSISIDSFKLILTNEHIDEKAPTG